MDFYVGERKSGRGCLVAVLLVVAAVGVLLFLRTRRPAKEPPAATPAGAPAAPAAADPGESLLAETRRLKAEDRLQEAREKAYELLDRSGNARSRAQAEELLGAINVDLVLSLRSMPEKTEYVVESGDSLAALAKKFGTTVDVIRKGNRIPGTVIRAGDRMRIFGGKFSITVDKSDNTLVLALNDRFFKRYRVGTGEYGRTPTGAFTVREKIPQPTWWRPDGKAIPYGDTNNVLGTHWLSLDIPGYGLHGTWEQDTIGRQASAGCIRLLNRDIEEIFSLVSEGTPVVITD